MLYIGYRFNTSQSSRNGMRFEIEETDEIVTHERRGPVYNGVTPTEGVTVATPDEAFSVLTQWIGRSWDAWSLVYVIPIDRDPYYAVVPHTTGRKSKIHGAPIHVICSYGPQGRFINASLRP